MMPFQELDVLLGLLDPEAVPTAYPREDELSGVYVVHDSPRITGAPVDTPPPPPPSPVWQQALDVVAKWLLVAR